MNPFSHILPEALHHAYIVEGDRDASFEYICTYCEEGLETPIQANPDFWHHTTDRFTIGHARTLREMQMKKSVGERKKIFIVSFNFITREAQNALLKVLEEPTDGTHIFITTPSSRVFLDTVLSRVVVLEHGGGGGNSEGISAPEFIASSYKERLATVTKLVKDIKDEKRSKAIAILLVQDISQHLHRQLESNPQSIAKKLKQLQKIESYLHDTSSSVKVLLEYVATIA